MNDSLIKQLELAIAVIKGEIPHDEIECRHERNSNWDKKVTPINSWEFHHYEYRRKPKLLELWVNIYEYGVITAHKTQEDATDCMPVSVCGHCKLYHMKEVL